MTLVEDKELISTGMKGLAFPGFSLSFQKIRADLHRQWLAFPGFSFKRPWVRHLMVWPAQSYSPTTAIVVLYGSNLPSISGLYFLDVLRPYHPGPRFKSCMDHVFLMSVLHGLFQFGGLN